MMAIPNSGSRSGRSTCKRGVGHAVLAILILLSPFWTPAAEQRGPSPHAKARAAYALAKQVWQKNRSDPAAAWQFARAAFDLAELDEDDRARLAEEAINACRKSLTTNTNGGNYYYLALNLGQLARTKKLGALRLVDEMEIELKNAIAIDPKFDYAGAHRSLGMLYRDAPGWPASIGSRSKAKQHLLKAVQVASEYPDNHISLIESLIEWADLKAARAAVLQAESPMRQARLELTGDRWKEAWRDWDRRWERIRRRTDVDLTSPRGGQ